jgi:hypothetical protein
MPATQLGFLLVTVGFLGGALASVLSEDTVRWDWFAAAVIVGFAGVVLVRISQRMETRDVSRLSANMQAIETSLRRIAENATRLNADKHTIDPYDVRHRIEELFADDLNTFIEARESIAHSYGLAAYADVMNCFAAGERYLNRVWSASADGYVDEINDYLDRAREQFAAGLDRVLRLQGGSRVA